MSTSSGFGPSSTATVRGSSAMPQIGQAPGAGRDDLRVHRAGVLDPRRWRDRRRSGSSAMPHFGQAPGWSWPTSGIHRADVARAGRRRRRGVGAGGRGREERLGRLLEPRQAGRMAEVVGLPLVAPAAGRVRPDRSSCRRPDRERHRVSWRSSRRHPLAFADWARPDCGHLPRPVRRTGRRGSGSRAGGRRGSAAPAPPASGACPGARRSFDRGRRCDAGRRGGRRRCCAAGSATARAAARSPSSRTRARAPGARTAACARRCAS